MKSIRIVAALLMLAAPSYVSAATPKGRLGASLPPLDAAGAGRPAPAGLPDAPALSGRNAARFSAALNALEPEGRSSLRGAKEVQLYQTASPSVVLIVSDESLGSGALISADGQVITNLHVVGDAEVVGLVFKPKTEGGKITEADVRPARVVRRDEVADLALLQVAEVPAGVRPLALAGVDAVQVGSDVHAIGHPTGETWTYTRGIVSQIRRDYAWAAEDRVKHSATVIQTQTPINPGNSGGPLINDRLEIVGINSFGGEGEGLNFAVSADDVKALVARSADRMVAAADKPKAPDPSCEGQTLAERASEDPAGRELAIDDDCDGVADYLAVVPDDEDEPITLLSDDDGDGKIDTVLIDEGRDGDFDLALYDTDADGKPDLQGEFKPGESEPFRLERIAE